MLRSYRVPGVVGICFLCIFYVRLKPGREFHFFIRGGVRISFFPGLFEVKARLYGMGSMRWYLAGGRRGIVGEVVLVVTYMFALMSAGTSGCRPVAQGRLPRGTRAFLSACFPDTGVSLDQGRVSLARLDCSIVFTSNDGIRFSHGNG